MMKQDLYQLTGTVDELRRQFQAALASDRVAEQKSSRYGITAGIGCGTVFLGIFAAIVIADVADVALGWLIPLAGLPIAIYGGVKFLKWSKFDLDNRKLGLVHQFLSVIGADTPAGAEVELKIDFRDYQEGGELLSEEKDTTIRFSAPLTKKYTHEWFQVTGTLADGTSYRVEVANSINRKEKPKRKYTKVKERIRGTIAVQLALKPSRYGDAAAVVSMLEATPPPAPLELRAARGQGKRLSVAVTTPQYLSVDARRSSHTEGEEYRVSGDMVLKTLVWVYDAISRSGQAAA